jgi:hypothetical protein
MKDKLLFIITTVLLVYGCSEDDNIDILLNQEGTVLTETSCNTENNGLAYTVDVDDLENVEFIITATLPEEFKQEGLRIQFDMQPSRDGLTICTASFLPEQFYKISNVTIIANDN